MIVECDNCGAPLDVKDAQRFAKCGYCQATSRIKSLRTMAMETPAGWEPPKEWMPPPHRRAAATATTAAPLTFKPDPTATTTSSGGGLNAGCVTVVLALCVGGGAAVYFLQKGGSGVLPFGINVNAPPTMGVFDPGPAPQLAVARPGHVSGTYPASMLGSGCRGYLSRPPQLALRFATSQLATLETASNVDLTMVIREPNGTVRCDDDSGQGQNPRISGGFAAGTYLVWIGTYHQGTSSDFTLSVATEQIGGGTPLANGLVPDAPPPLGGADLDATPDVAGLMGSVTGRLRAETLGSGCRGYIRPGPHFVFRTRQPRALAITTTGSTSDLVMVVREPSGAVRCDDDSGEGNNPLVRGAFAPGDYQVWVGTYSENATSPFVLSVRTEATGAMPLANGLIPGAPSAQPAVDLDAPGNAVVTRNGTTAGTIAGPTLGAGCTGYFTAVPTLTVSTARARRVRVKAIARGETVSLFVRGQAGETTCAASTPRGGRAEVELDLAPGSSGVWVGAPLPARTLSYGLAIEPAR